MTEPRRHGRPFVWVTWLTGLLSGDKHCQWATWYRAHFRFAKRPDTSFDLAAWTTDHNALVYRRRTELEAERWTCTVEGQNDLKLAGKTALLSGKPDLIATRGIQVRVSDAKTGTPRASDFWQVLIYQLAIPLMRPAFARPDGIEGEVVYPTTILPVSPRDLTPDRRDAIFALMRTMGDEAEPPRTPSAHECKWCDVLACPDRIVVEDVEAVAVQEF